MFLTDLLIVFAAAGVVVFLFQMLKLPAVVGLLVAGMIVGPHSLGLVEETEAVTILSEVGIVVLLFSVGLEFSLSRVLAMTGLMLKVGFPQVLLSIAATAGVAYLIGGDWRPAVFAGMLVAMSSTAVVIKMLADRGELDAPHGRVAVAVLLLQDLLVVVFVLAVPILAPPAGPGEGQVIPMASEPAGSAPEVVARPPWQALLLGVVTVAGILLAGKFVLPRVLYQVVRTRNRELFLIAIFLVCIGTASLTGAVGLSLALGAFLAGLTLSESEYGQQTLSEVLPFRDTLSSLFFVSVGMLLDLKFVTENAGTVAAVIAGLFALKFVAAAGPAAVAGMPIRVVLTTGLALAQIGEFSFVLALSGRAAGLMTGDQYQIFLAAAVGTMALTPFAIAAGPPLADRLAESRRVNRWLNARRPADDPTADHLSDHVVIAGYGFNGRNLAVVLRDLDIPYVILELNPETVRTRRAAGESMLYGDCTRPPVLHHAGIERAKVYVLAISDPSSTRRSIQLARAMNPDLRVIVRTHYQREIGDLEALGADRVVPEEFETSLAVFGCVLSELHVSPNVIRKLTDDIREDRYEAFREGDFGRIPVELPADLRAAIETDACPIPEGSHGVDKTIGELQLRQRTGASVVAVRRGEQVLTNPGADFRFRAGDVVVLLGQVEQTGAATELLHGEG